MTGEVEWFAANLLASARAGMEFPLPVARRRGPAALVEEPRLVVCSPSQGLFVSPERMIAGARPGSA